MKTQKMHHFKQNLCLFCGRTGHIVKECPKVTSFSSKGYSTTATMDKNSDTKPSMESKNPWAVL